MFVIKNTVNGRYVARSGSKSAFTPSLEYARVFSTYEKAKANACLGNEHVLPLNALLPPIQPGD